jgi:putative nucleotidyltransferase with HDIG domain
MTPDVLRTKVERLVNIPAAPASIDRLSGILSSRSMSAIEVGEAIGEDQVLTAKALKIANSGFYGYRGSITTLTQATVVLGFNVVKTLVLTASALDVIDMMKTALDGLWEHSLATARASALLADRIGCMNPEEVAVAGLLHDLGKVVIAHVCPAEYAAIREMVTSGGALVHEAEHEILGVGHPEVATWLVRKWSLPSRLVYPITYHHAFHPSREFADCTAVVHVADVIARAKAIGNPGDRRLPAIDRGAWAVLGIDMDDVEDICLQLDVEFSEEAAA